MSNSFIVKSTFHFPHPSSSSSSPWYICFFLFHLLRDYQIVKRWRRLFYHHFLVLLARISHYKASECEMKKNFLLGVVIYVLTQLLPFIYTTAHYVYAEIIWRRDLCYYFDKKNRLIIRRWRQKSFYFANWMNNFTQ